MCKHRARDIFYASDSSFPLQSLLSSLDISVTLFQKLHNTLLEVWVEGKGCKGSGGWRQDTDLSCDDSFGFLPLTSTTLLGGGESVTTESNLKDSRGFRHFHKHSLPRETRVNKRALPEPCGSFTRRLERITLPWFCMLYSPALPLSNIHAHSARTRGRKLLTHLFHH